MSPGLWPSVASQGCRNKGPQAGPEFLHNRNFFSHSLEAGNPKSTYWPCWFFLRPLSLAWRWLSSPCLFRWGKWAGGRKQGSITCKPKARQHIVRQCGAVVWDMDATASLCHFPAGWSPASCSASLSLSSLPCSVPTEICCEG